MTERVREVDAGRAHQYIGWAQQHEARMEDYKSRVYIALEHETEVITRARRMNSELEEELQYAFTQHENLTHCGRRAGAAYYNEAERLTHVEAAAHQRYNHAEQRAISFRSSLFVEEAGINQLRQTMRHEEGRLRSEISN